MKNIRFLFWLMVYDRWLFIFISFIYLYIYILLFSLFIYIHIYLLFISFVLIWITEMIVYQKIESWIAYCFATIEVLLISFHATEQRTKTGFCLKSHETSEVVWENYYCSHFCCNKKCKIIYDVIFYILAIARVAI